MKGASVFKKILFSSWFLAGIPALLILALLPPIGSKYTLSTEKLDHQYKQYAFSDLNCDSISEIVCNGKGTPFFYICAFNSDMKVYDQWNLADSLTPNISEFFFGNYDHNGYREIYIFTNKGDSLFLNVNEILDPTGTKINRLFITKIGYLKGQVAALLKPAGFFDQDGDGKDELYFIISSHYKSGPRRLYSINLVKKELNTSQFTGNIELNPKMMDVDGDNRVEIFGSMYASGNFRTNIPYSDSSNWLMVFKDNLDFKFPPVEFKGFANGLDISIFNTGKASMFILTHTVGGVDTSVLKPQLMIYSSDGKFIRNRLVSDLSLSRYYQTFVIKYKGADKIFLIADKVFELNYKLEVLRERDLPTYKNVYNYAIDIDNDGNEELLIYDQEEDKLVIYNGELKKLCEQKIKTSEAAWTFYHSVSKTYKPRLFMASGTTGYFLDLKRNNYYYLGYTIYPSIYFLFFLFILAVRKINTQQIQQKESLKRRLVTLQLQGIKSQLDPHFTFNTLNSVASLIYTEERQTAYDYMNKFTLLLRGMINDAERIYRSVSEELQFVTTYLDLEKLRFGEKFNYSIEIGDGVTQKEQVPKLVLQTFSENAIKHGIMPSEKGGTLLIKVEREKEDIKLTVEDNGIGREQAAGQSTSTGKGLKLTQEFYDILNQINTKPIKLQITDLYSESKKPVGTRVEIWVPLELNQDKR